MRLVKELLGQQNVDGPLEILVVNDNGGPEVFECLSRLAPGPVPLRFFDTGYSGYGPVLARNAGLRFARYDTVIFLDDDVSIGPDLVSRYQRAPEGIRIGRIDFAVEIDGQSRIYPDRRAKLMTGEDRLVKSGGACLFLVWSANFCIPTDLGVRLGGFDEAFLDEGEEDCDFGARLIFATRRLIVVPSARAVHEGPDLVLRQRLGLPVTVRVGRAADRLCARGTIVVNGGAAYWRDPKWSQMIR
jgi:glycosyltransferase involved in cell wall biosynthesis